MTRDNNGRWWVSLSVYRGYFISIYCREIRVGTKTNRKRFVLKVTKTSTKFGNPHLDLGANTLMSTIMYVSHLFQMVLKQSTPLFKDFLN